MKTETKTEPDLTKVHNEMIALWMGVKNVWVHPKFGVYEAEDETGYIDWVDVGIRSLDYHKNWNLLMPVVEKIESLHDASYLCRIVSRRCIIYDSNIADQSSVYQGSGPGIIASNINQTTKHEAVFKSIVEFLRWYNSQESKQP